MIIQYIFIYIFDYYFIIIFILYDWLNEIYIHNRVGRVDARNAVVYFWVLAGDVADGRELHYNKIYMVNIPNI